MKWIQRVALAGMVLSIAVLGGVSTTANAAPEVTEAYFFTTTYGGVAYTFGAANRSLARRLCVTFQSSPPKSTPCRAGVSGVAYSRESCILRFRGLVAIVGVYTRPGATAAGRTMCKRFVNNGLVRV